VPCYCECASQESTNSETLPQDPKALAEIVRSLRKPPILSSVQCASKIGSVSWFQRTCLFFFLSGQRLSKSLSAAANLFGCGKCISSADQWQQHGIAVGCGLNHHPITIHSVHHPIHLCNARIQYVPAKQLWFLECSIL